jgi:hypothetical protein
LRGQSADPAQKAAESGSQRCERTSNALAEPLRVTPTHFPGGHTGFAEQPAEFAEALRAEFVEVGFDPGA